MKIVVDTSILFQALYSSRGASHEILKMVRRGDVQLALSIPVFQEYCDVLSRPSSLKQFGLPLSSIQSVLDFIALVGIKTDIRFLLRPNLQDENDNIFMELAFACDSRYIITRNSKDFLNNAELRFGEIKILTPADFLKEWRMHHA